MNERCIFCGIELGVLQKKTLSCGNTTQVLCKDCYNKYKRLPAIERAEAALKTGRVADRENLQKYLEKIYNARAEKIERQKEKNDKRASNLECLRCKGRMLDYGPITFKLGEETYFFSDWNRLASGSLTMKLYRCENCGKAEFFINDSTELDKTLDE